MRKFYIFYFVFLFSLMSKAQWKSINPGAGGQVQDVVCDPNIENRLYLASDMEGIYISNDNGISWHPKGELLHNRVYAVAITPGNSDKIFAGTLYGLEISTNGGENFKLVELTRRKSIGVIAINPFNPNVIIAGMGWRDDLDFSNKFGLDSNGNGEIFRSEDGGKTWKTIYFDQDQTSNRNVLTIQFDPIQNNTVYMGSSKGVFKSLDNGLSWEKIKAPEGTTNNWGAALSPDGKILYATYALQGKKGKIYATSTKNINWLPIMKGEGLDMKILDYWYPEVDGRSTNKEHKLIVGLQHSREGLFEGTIKWNQEKLEHISWNTIWSGVGGFDPGWDNAHTNPRFVHYTPKSWKRALWSTTNQTIFQAEPMGNGYQWNNRYSIPNYNFQVPHWDTFWPTYSGRGTESTYTYDVAAFENYIIQGQADNGFVESWDNGFSWSNVQHRNAPMNLSDVQAVDIAISKKDKTPIVIAQATGGYGGGAVDGRLYVKKMKNLSPNDEWFYLAGGAEKKGGMPKGIYRDIAVSPVKQDRIFAFSTDEGLFMIDDIDLAIEEVKNQKMISFEKISNGILNEVISVKKISPHPTNKDIVYLNGAKGNQGVYKGELIDGQWHWTKIYNGSSWDAEIVSWEFNGQVYLFYSGQSNEKGGDGKHFVGALSMDEGKTWKTVINRKDALKLKDNSWYENLKDDFGFYSKGGIIGYKNHIIMNFYDHKMQKAFGIFKGTISKKGKVTWEDWTGDIGYGGLTSAILNSSNGKNHIIVSTAGAGAWMREIE